MRVNFLDLLIKNCRDELYRKGMTVASLATALGISRQALAHFFSGEHEPRLDRIIEIANVLELKPFQLLMDDGERALWDTAKKLDPLDYVTRRELQEYLKTTAEDEAKDAVRREKRKKEEQANVDRIEFAKRHIRNLDAKKLKKRPEDVDDPKRQLSQYEMDAAMNEVKKILEGKVEYTPELERMLEKLNLAQNEKLSEIFKDVPPAKTRSKKSAGGDS